MVFFISLRHGKRTFNFWIVNTMGKIFPIEIKSGKTVNTDFFKHLKYLNKLSNNEQSLIIYSGELEQQRSDGTKIINWHHINSLDFT